MPTRRQLLTAGLSLGGIQYLGGFNPLIRAATAGWDIADPDRHFVFLYFRGGWDILKNLVLPFLAPRGPPGGLFGRSSCRPFSRDVSGGIETTCIQLPPVLVGDFRSLVAMVEVILPVGTHHDRVQAVVVVLAVETGQQHLPPVYTLVEHRVAVDVSVDD